MFEANGVVAFALFGVKGVKDEFPPKFGVPPVGEPIMEARKGLVAPPVI